MNITVSALSDAGVDLDRIVLTPDDVWHVTDADGVYVAAFAEAGMGWDFHDERTQTDHYFHGDQIPALLSVIAEACIPG